MVAATLITLLILCVVLSESLINNRHISSCLQTINRSNLKIWISRRDPDVGIKVIKECSIKGLICRVFQSDLLEDSEFVLGDHLPLNKTNGKSLYAFNFEPNWKITGETQMDQELFLINLQTKDWFEVYYLNGYRIENNLGRVELLNDSIHFIGNPFSKLYFMDRRKDFQGKHFVAMTEEQAPYIQFKANFMKDAKYFQENSTYEVTNYMTGVILELIQEIMRFHNATIAFYKRKDGIWGSLKNGSMNGMFINLLHGNANIIAASMGRTLDRDQHADFLPPIDIDRDAIFIKASGKQESHFSWAVVLLKPLCSEVWFLILVQSIGLAVLITILDSLHEGHLTKAQHLIGFTGRLWSFLTINLGNGYNSLSSHKQQVKIAVFMFLISGSLIWLHYGAFIYAKLSFDRHDLPFDSLETLLTSDYEVNLRRGGLFHDRFIGADPSTIKGKLYQSKINPKGENRRTSEDLKHLLDNEKQAYMFYYGSVKSHEEFKCKVSPIYLLLACYHLHT